jgi:hypothetical protein
MWQYNYTKLKNWGFLFCIKIFLGWQRCYEQNVITLIFNIYFNSYMRLQWRLVGIVVSTRGAPQFQRPTGWAGCKSGTLPNNKFEIHSWLLPSVCAVVKLFWCRAVFLKYKICWKYNHLFWHICLFLGCVQARQTPQDLAVQNLQPRMLHRWRLLPSGVLKLTELQ